MSKKKIKSGHTLKSLKEAFGFECFAEMRCKLFGTIAKGKDGCPHMAEGFNDVARSHNQHALLYFELLKDSDDLCFGFEVKNLMDNLKCLLKSELHAADISAGLIKTARDEGYDDIAAKVEEVSLACMSSIYSIHALESKIIHAQGEKAHGPEE